MIFKYTIDKETKTISRNTAPPVKITLIYLDLENDKIITKIGSYTAYVDRSVGTIYVPAYYSIDRIVKVENQKNHIVLYIENIQEIPVKENTDQLDYFIKETSKLPIVSELDKLPKSEREFYLKRRKDFEDFRNSCDNVKKYKDSL